MDNKDLTIPWYKTTDIQQLKQGIKDRAVLFEVELIKWINDYVSEQWERFTTDSLVQFYISTMNTAMMTNKIWWEDIDTKARMAAADKLTKILSGWLWSSKWWITINVQNNNLWNNLPNAWEALKY